MTKKPKEPTNTTTPDADHYMPGDPIPVPHAVEADSESVWAHFTDTSQHEEPDFADTVAASSLEELGTDKAPKNPH